jgi:hypothetical protein
VANQIDIWPHIGSRRFSGRSNWFDIFESGKGKEASALTGDIDAFVCSQASVLSQIEEEEQTQAAKVQAFHDHKSSVIPWVRSCGFDGHLHGLDRKEIRRSWRRPDHDEIQGDSVQRIADVAVQLLEEMWTWCVDGPMAVVLSQFWTQATVHSRGFRVGKPGACHSIFVVDLYWAF